MVIRIASPLFSKMQLDLQRLDNAMLRLTSGIAMVAFPMMVGMALTANELVIVLLGEQWLDAIFPLQILCLVGVLKSVDPLITQAFISIGKANVTARYTTLCAVIIPLSVLFGAMQGTITAVAVALAVSYPISSIYLFYSAKAHLHFSMRRYLAAIRMPAEASLWMSCWVIATAWLLGFAGLHSPFWILLAKTLVGVLSYLLFMVHIRQQGLHDCYEVLQELGISAEKLNRWPFNKIHGQN
jgi:O-antigen/teichoic acid export membrane protein